jgi:pyruvate,water dikinase
MQEKKEVNREEFIKWFSEINKNSQDLVGEKAVNLAEIYNLKLSVPQGFVITKKAYDYFIEKSGIKEKIQELLERLNYENLEQVEETTRQIRTFILGSEMPEDLEKDILEEYETLGATNLELVHGSALDILNNAAEPIFVAVRSSQTSTDTNFIGQHESYMNVKGKSSLIENIKKCFASLFTSRATYSRYKKGISNQVSIAVIIQKMIDSTKSGVILSKNYSENKDITLEAVWGLGEGIVSGKITPDKYIISEDLEIKERKIADKKIALTRDSSGIETVVRLREEKSKHQVLKDYEIKKLAQITLKLEEYYKAPQIIEFAIEGEDIYIIQTRPMNLEKLNKNNSQIIETPFISGIPASNGIAKGKVRIIEKQEDLSGVKKGDILVINRANPQIILTMENSSGIVCDEGGTTSHVALLSREKGIPCIVEATNATEKLKEGQEITLNGYSGNIYTGETTKAQPKEISQPKINSITKINSNTKIKLLVNTKNYSNNSEIKEAGLVKIEGIIANSKKHPEYFLHQNKISEYEEIIYSGLNEISNSFTKLWIRTSDLPSNEYKNLEGSKNETEENPLLGLSGIRYGLKNKPILKAELNAINRIQKQGKKIGILLPKIISAEEITQVKKILNEINANEIELGAIIETPASVQIIKELTQTGIKCICIEIENLTEYLLAIDKKNPQVKELFNLTHPAVLYQLDYVIRVCKRNNIETSMCITAKNSHELIKYTIERGIDSIVLPQELTKEISNYIYGLEQEKIIGTDKEPRQYQPEKEEVTKEPEEIQEEMQAIEEEKQEYLEANPKEDYEEKNPFVEEPSKIEEDIKAIEEEKQEYLNSEECSEEPTDTESELNIFD